jgi:flagellar biosynthesis protein FlhF
LTFRTPLTDFMDRIETTLRSLQQSIDELQNSKPWPGPPPELLAQPLLAQFYARLVANEIDPALAAEWLGRLRPATARQETAERIQQRLAGIVFSSLRTESRLGGDDPPAVVALAGPCGSGKTTAVAKVAIRYGVACGRAVHLISADPHRVGAVEQLEAYARLAGLPLRIITDVDSLPDELGKLRTSDDTPELILIDTPGYTASEWPQAVRLARQLALERAEVHLVISLAAKPGDVRREVERFAAFEPSRLLFTHLDATPSHGMAVNEAVRTGLPLSFFSAGPNVPENLLPATETGMLDMILGPARAR